MSQLYFKPKLIEPAMTTIVNTLPSDDAWLLTEKFSVNLPINDVSERNCFVPSCVPPEYPKQYEKMEPKSLEERWNCLNDSYYEYYITATRKIRSKRGIVILMYSFLFLFGLFTLFYTFWVYRYK